MFEKYYQQKLAVDSTATYTVKDVLECEKLCLELTDSCLAINVIYKGGNYICDVIANSPHIGGVLEKPRIGNQGGKLIIKRGKHLKDLHIVQDKHADRHACMYACRHIGTKINRRTRVEVKLKFKFTTDFDLVAILYLVF